jgi:hypothetical protein
MRFPSPTAMLTAASLLLPALHAQNVTGTISGM